VASVSVDAQGASRGDGFCCTGLGTGGAGVEDGPNPSVTSWVRDPTQQVRAPSGQSASSCEPWQAGNPFFEDGGHPQAAIPANIPPDGREYRYWYRTCGSVFQDAWAAVFTAQDLVPAATADMRARIPRPTVSLSPPAAVGGFVALETWLGVEPMAPVSATAGPTFGGLTVTATAVPSRIEWTPGDPAVATITCELWGATRPDGADGQSAPCGWTPRVPSAPQYGGGADENFHGTVTIVWTASWTASTGESGALDTVDTTTAVTYRVREIQTIGEDR
jgi:hypothetical protein